LHALRSAARSGARLGGILCLRPLRRHKRRSPPASRVSLPRLWKSAARLRRSRCEQACLPPLRPRRIAQVGRRPALGGLGWVGFDWSMASAGERVPRVPSMRLRGVRRLHGQNSDVTAVEARKAGGAAARGTAWVARSLGRLWPRLHQRERRSLGPGARLGHAAVSITLDTYSHAIPAMQGDAERFAGLVLAQRPRG